MADNKGLKRICMHCGMRFYDLNRDPIVCPSCGTEYTGDMKVKPRRSRAATAPEPRSAGQVKGRPADDETEEDETVLDDDTEELDETEEDDETVSLDDLEEDDDLDDDEETLDDEEDDELAGLDDLDEDIDDIDDEEELEDDASDEDEEDR